MGIIFNLRNEILNTGILLHLNKIPWGWNDQFLKVHSNDLFNSTYSSKLLLIFD